jgi:mono/diheme cytochrome c family protein
MRRVIAAAALGIAGTVTACGGAASPQPVSGAAVFVRDCTYCHSLIGNESLHRQGGDLLGYTLTRQQLLEQTRQMPARKPLTPAQLKAVVDYVQAMQQRARTR